jgi:hypothetical protein
MLQSETVLGARLSIATAAADVGVTLDPAGYINESATTSTTWGSISCAALGLVGTPQVFRSKVPTQTVQIGGRILVRVPWTLTTQGSDAASRGTVRVTLTIDGTVITTGDGGPRNLNSTNGTRFTELIALVMPSAAVMPPGAVVDITITPLITVAGGTTYTPALRHDPTAPDDQLVIEFQGLGGVN